MNEGQDGTAGAFLDNRDGVATIILQREGRLNAFRLETWLALPELVAAADEARGAGVIVVRGAFGNFGAGNDISELRSLPGHPDAARRYGRAMADAMLAVESTSKPVVMAIEGVCYGASVALALAGDLRIASDTATFAITPVKLGAVLLRSDLHRLVAAVGAGRSSWLLLLGEAIGAREARDAGLVDRLLPADAFEAGLTDVAEALLRGSPITQRLTRKMLRTPGILQTPAETEESLGWFVEATQGVDFAEGVQAFLDRRQPRFR